MYLYHPTIRQTHADGDALDDGEKIGLPTSIVDAFIARLSSFGYAPEGASSGRRSFVKLAGGSTITVAVHSSEISFTVPTSDSGSDAVFEALQDACELSDGGDLEPYDPQTEEWLNAV
ncbi:hypothetical protein [Usitatibacter rugosus]|uniref:hypothetical protein n=1 Tax=Usitatibacter rugosus TaxID=2732067 RepID=UPI001488B3D4|nr:hypothetical protein [Usitatibacter rugosus]